MSTVDNAERKRRSSSADTDSGLVDDYTDLLSDAFDVLPAESLLKLDRDLELDDLDDVFIDGSLDSDSSCDFIVEDIDSDDNETTDKSSVDKLPEIGETRNVIDSNEALERSDDLKTPHAPHRPKLPGKRAEYDGEAARNWRRKRMLNNTVTKLVALPNKLTPVKPTSAEKLRDPLLGGEKIRANREPVPMRLRPLPPSFWKEPSQVTPALAGAQFSVLPPIFHDAEDLASVRPVTPPEEKGRSPRHSPRHKKKMVQRQQEEKPELLMKLFDHLESRVDESKIVRRGRPKKQASERRPLSQPSRDPNEDPCIGDALKLFPELSLKQAKENSHNLAGVLKIGRGQTNVVEFPAIQQQHSYSAILDELVTHM